MEPLPSSFVEDFYLARKRFVEELARGVFNPSKLLELSTRLSVMVATSGPAGINVAPFMVSFVPKQEYLGEVNKRFREFLGSGGSMREAAELLLETVYNDGMVDSLKLVSHLMNRGHTWINVEATGKAALGILVPPDKAAYEVRTRATIIGEGPLYEYANLVHDVVHARGRNVRSHPWCPALLFEIDEIYDNSYQALGRRIYP